ncbi:MAG: hypothetical protein JKY42_02110 [Flavobacteriales bacterium]|nr:hypothetical protein [Flavobacteriales bacterium]
MPVSVENSVNYDNIKQWLDSNFIMSEREKAKGTAHWTGQHPENTF